MVAQTQKVDWLWVPFHALTVYQLEKLYQLRQKVFIVEQNCPYQDVDGHDQAAIHLLGMIADNLVASVRFFPEFEEFDGNAAIGRVCTDHSVRGTGIGRELMQQAIDYSQANFPKQAIQLGAQSYLQKFYQDFGFVVVSEEYLEDGIPHKMMLLKATE